MASNEPPFPYNNLLYISAASRFEEAKDIPSAQLALRPTIDAKPHGALTNALLKGMSGEADANHDGEITYNEIYQYVQFEVSRDFKHFPQMLQPIAGGMETRAAFGGRPIRMDRPRPRESGVTLVKLRTGGDDLRAGLLRIASVRLSDGYYDLLIEETRSGYDLIHKSGNLMKHYDKEASAELLRRIGRQTLVDKLIDARFSKQNFNASIRVLPETKGTYYGGELLQLEAISEKEGCPLVLNIDVTGTVIVVYPLLDEQSKRLQAGVRTILGRDIEVLAPFGLEYLKLLVIAGDTKVCAEWAGKSLTPDNPEFDKLLALAQSSESGRAQTSLRLFSRER